MEEPKVDIKEKDITSENKMEDENRDQATEAGEEKKEEEKKEEEKEEDFVYLEQREGEEPSIFEYSSEENNINEAENIFKPLGLNSKYVICILLKEDDQKDSELLKVTLKGIIQNFGALAELGIDPENILIFVFLSKNKKNELVSKEIIKEKLKEENKNSYLLKHMKWKDDGRDIKIEIVSKKNYMNDMECLKCFYCQIVHNLKQDKKILITSVLTAGVIPNNTALYDLIKSCLLSEEDKNKLGKINDCVSVPALEINKDVETENFFSKIIRYERAHFNIYNMNHYYSAGVVPVLSLMNTMSIDKNLMNVLQTFYSNIEIRDDSEMPKIDYHDYNLGLFLYQNKIRIKYIGSQSLGSIIYRDFDYKYIWVSKYSGYYSNFFEILKALMNFDLPIFHKIFMLFQIIGMLIEFVYLGLSILVIYSILVEAFDVRDSHPAIFMTMLYIIMYLGSGVSSLISDKSKDNNYTNMIYYYFMEVYYLFILVCSVPAMDNIKKKKLFGEKLTDVPDFYKFNIPAITCLIIFTFILAILPMVFRIGMVTENIVPMIFYLIFGATPSTSNFLIAKIWNAPGASGGKTVEDRKGITVLFYLLFNLFFGFLSVYIYERKLRAKCVMGLAIAYLIYLFFKTAGIVLSSLGSPNLAQLNSAQAKKILTGNNIYESKNSSDHLNNEEKLDKNSNEEKEKEDNNEENKEENKEDNNEENKRRSDDESNN